MIRSWKIPPPRNSTQTTVSPSRSIAFARRPLDCSGLNQLNSIDPSADLLLINFLPISRAGPPVRPGRPATYPCPHVPTKSLSATTINNALAQYQPHLRAGGRSGGASRAEYGHKAPPHGTLNDSDCDCDCDGVSASAARNRNRLDKSHQNDSPLNFLCTFMSPGSTRSRGLRDVGRGGSCSGPQRQARDGGRVGGRSGAAAVQAPARAGSRRPPARVGYFGSGG